MIASLSTVQQQNYTNSCLHVFVKSKTIVPLLTLYLPHYESQYLVHLQILIKIAQETSSFHTYGVNDLLDLPGEHCVK